MVDVRMRQPDLRKGEVQAFDLGQDAGQVATWVNDGRLPGLVTPDQGAVLLERGYGDGEVIQHVPILVYCN